MVPLSQINAGRSVVVAGQAAVEGLLSAAIPLVETVQ
jgi:hypothetical protein